ncbi:MAG: sigma-54-dependent Fis family transcriptional regulator [Myxococcales bacterium]|nr:MAG: sigma-54-dependent Fis family transcriptional regulator [Myxococcales bacterium]
MGRLSELTPELAIVALLEDEPLAGASGEVGSAAFDYISRPFDADSALDTIQRALSAARHCQARPPAPPLPSLKELLVRSPAMRSVMTLLERVAPSEATVMIRGESGTGKEVVARRLHELSGRAAGPLVKVHCAALPEQILESELFGYERGAFTGAHTRKPGRVELAERGTLFLDEIGEISMSVQVKLLRLLQDRQYERLGGTRTLAADVRFVTATHRNLEQMVRRGAFREDLYYRLNVVRLDLPPLRERREDIEPLARHFCRQTNNQIGRQVDLTPEALARIVQDPWRGNVRELQNFVERLVVLSDGTAVSEQDVRLEQERALGLAGGSDPGVESSVISLDAALRRAERQALEKALRKAAGNRALAARILGVSRRALFYKLREHDIK